jgi:translation initiation factor 2B subunit (eIF-2B alpha/beta/delta family)
MVIMNYEDLIQDIEEDNSSGASEIVKKANQCLLSFSKEFESDSKQEFLKKVIIVGKKLIKAQPEMAPLFNFVNGMILILNEQLNIVLDVGEQKRFVHRFSQEFLLQAKMAQNKIQKRVLDLIDNNSTIMTHSYSSTVIKSLLYAEKKGKVMKVIVLESRPIYEGRKTAKILSEHDIETTLIADMAAFNFLDEVDLILTGCDSICQAGIVNKIGTKGLAMAASISNIPFYVIGEKNKMLPSAYLKEPKIEKRDPFEIFEESGKINIHNIYFDKTPYKYIHGIVCEDQMVAPFKIENLLGNMMVASELIL